MKKTALILLVCMLAALCATAFADGLTVVERAEYVRKEFDTSSYGSIYAEVRNDSDKPISLSKVCDVRFYDTDGEMLEEYTDRYGFPSVLQPGETGYISEDVFLLAGARDVGKGELVLHPDPELPDMVSTRTPVTATLDLDALNAADDEDCYIFIELENTTDELLGEFSISTAMWNQHNKIMFAYSGYVSALVPPGEKGIVRIELPFSLIEAWREKGDVPTYLESFRYETRSK